MAQMTRSSGSTWRSTSSQTSCGRKQGLAFQISDLEVMLQASRLLVYKAAAMKDSMEDGGGAPMKDFKQAASVAKLYATESAVTATRIATQVFGGYGFMEEYPVERFYRDAKVLEIGEGTSEVQRMLIARVSDSPWSEVAVNWAIREPALSLVLMGERWQRFAAEVGRFLAVGLVATLVALIIFNFLVHGYGADGLGPLNDSRSWRTLIANAVGMLISFRGTKMGVP